MDSFTSISRLKQQEAAIPPSKISALYIVRNGIDIRAESQPVLVTLCNSSKDKYPFGYNDQMKMNEVTGTGNTVLH